MCLYTMTFFSLAVPTLSFVLTLFSTIATTKGGHSEVKFHFFSPIFFFHSDILMLRFHLKSFFLFELSDNEV